MGDLESGLVMNRLVQGDVGSGKTIVAVLALLETAMNGYAERRRNLIFHHRGHGVFFLFFKPLCPLCPLW